MPLYTNPNHGQTFQRLLGEFAGVQPPAALNVTPQEVAAGSLTPGQRVLAMHPVDFQSLFDAFNQIFGAGFTWAPRQSYTATRVLETLEGTRTSGECKIIAGALLGLWVFPPPFGMGQANASPPASLYTFENYDANLGFISHHPLAGIKQLMPNILHPLGSAPAGTQPLYQWGDHKTVYYADQLWDPSYAKKWNHEAEMVAFEFTGVPNPADANAYQVKVVTPDLAKGWKAGDIMYFRMDALGGGWRGPYRDIR